MLIVLVIAGIAVVGCVVLASLGHGGEMAEFPPDVPPLDLPDVHRMTAADLVVLRLPISIVGYNTEAVDETLRRVSTALSERDTRIAVLEQRLAELTAGRVETLREAYARPVGARREPESLSAAEVWQDDRADAEESW
ncbi:hypothetical protein ACFHYQ_26095 [Sphaerimonospora cavernae]|uniref:DivIVA domain-containing protein n=1 Tax=Sphaerimonospora cavernae TaxID=1740611 RepID=A0ABV6UC55_9ACTN